MGNILFCFISNVPQPQSDELNLNGEGEVDPFSTENGQGDNAGLNNNGTCVFYCIRRIQLVSVISFDYGFG